MAQPAPSTPVPQRKRGGKLKWILGGVGALIVLGICTSAVASSGNGTKTASTTPTPSAAAKASATPAAKAPTPTPAAPKPQFATIHDGIHKIGADVQPGTYRTRSASSGCYFARLKGFGNSVDDLIANENTDGPTVVTIAGTDAGFQSERCATWTSDLSQITKSQTSFGEGTFIVGTDLQPGTYQNSGGQGCYYARLTGFGGTSDEIIANNNTDSMAIVNIAASDKGFTSSRCGTWTKV